MNNEKTLLQMLKDCPDQLKKARATLSAARLEITTATSDKCESMSYECRDLAQDVDTLLEGK